MVSCHCSSISLHLKQIMQYMFYVFVLYFRGILIIVNTKTERPVEYSWYCVNCVRVSIMRRKAEIVKKMK